MRTASEQKLVLSTMVDNRTRRTQVDMLALHQAIAEIVEEHRPLTVRHLFYLMVTQSLISKSDADYKQVVIRLASQMREEWLEQSILMERLHNGEAQPGDTAGALKLNGRAKIPFGRDYIVDAGRWIGKPESFAGPEAALKNCHDFYRRDLWINQPVQVHLFCEKDAIAELVFGETAQWDVPLGVMRGDSSKTFLWECAQVIEAANKPAISTSWATTT